MLVWYENVAESGSALFSLALHVVSANTAAVKFVAVADVDNDGDLDIWSTDHGNGYDVTPSVNWYENIGGTTSFLFSGVKQVVAGPALSLMGLMIVHAAAADLDGDGDVDFVVRGAAMPGWFIL